MKYKIFAIVCATAALSLAACSSTPKAAESSKPAAAAAQKAADTKAPAKKAKVEKAATTAGDGVSCVYGEVKRELKIVQSPDRCAVEYTKDGTTQEIGSGTANSPFCQEVVDRVKNNLTAAGYKCS